jgi:diguanylate cyclase (GGDEF)-like protein
VIPRRRRAELAGSALFRAERPPRLVLRFTVVLAITLALASALILVVVHQFTLAQAQRSAGQQAGLVASAVLQRDVSARDLAGRVSASRRRHLDAVFHRYVLSEDVVALSLVRKDGLVTYSTDHRVIGTIASGALAAEATAGTIVSRVSSANTERRTHAKTLETYAPVGPNTRGGAALIDQSYAPIEGSARSAELRVGAVLEALLISLVVLFVPLLVRVTRRIRGQIERIHRQAFYDNLTDLPNRVHLFERLELAVTRSTETGRQLAVLLLDLDRFREINETLGHGAGDVVLRETGARLESAVGDTMLVGRLGGDEFAVITEYGSEDEVDARAQDLRTVVEPPLRIGDVQLAVEATVGIALFPSDSGDADTLLKHAEVAMHTAKQWRVATLAYSPAVDPHDPEQIGLVAELRVGVENGELRLHYQPKVNLQTGGIVGFEALAYWQHPKRGLLPPGAFVPVAERTGAIRHISRAVLNDVVKQLAEWKNVGGDFSVAVNLTAIDLLDLNLPRRLEALLRRHRVAPRRLCIELTESAVMADPERAQSTLQRIAATGVRVAIDDFGTGHSALAYLKSLPAHELKVDKSFVSGMTISRQDRMIVLATITLAQSLGLRVVAEGVESVEVHNALKAIGCDYGQGYLYGRPSPLEDVVSLLPQDGEEAA